MTQTKPPCSTNDQLLTFLRGRLSAREEADLQQHLDDCVSCRERLESTAADASVWNEAKEFFCNGALHYSLKDSSDEHEETHQGSQRIRQVLDSLGPTDDPASLGRIGGYEVTGVVGAGGMGVVLKAHDRSLDRIVAIKVMSPHLASSGSARKRFAREAKAAAAVLHPNVIAIHSVASEDANPYLVMPFVRGASLQKRIDSQGPLPLKDTLRIGAQIAAGLAAAHEQGLVHRDIKPANILLEEGVERVTITDFGLARAVDDASMTCSGVIAGTPQYMSPEQARGEPINARSDLFSLGGVLYAMCTGRPPFRAETTFGVLHRIANDKPTPVCEVNSDVPVWLGHVIERLMAKRPEDRFESAAQVAELLEGCLAHVQQPAAIPLPSSVEQLSQLLPVSSSAPRPSKKRLGHLFYNLPPIGKYIAAAAFAFAFIFAGVLVVLELDKGTLTIQSDVDDVRVRVTRGEEIVDDIKVTKGEKSIRVAAGQYAVEVIGDTDGLTVENGQVTLHRADTEVVKITRNTHDDNLPTYTDPNAPLQANRSNSSDSLSETIDQFNFLRTKDPLNDQPALTKDELIACASWNVERNDELTEAVKSALRKIAKQYQWPEGWRIEGRYLDLPPDATPVRAYRISLVHSVTGEVFTIRERFVEPPSAYAKPVVTASPEGIPLAAAIKRFNARYKQANGHKQPPLTENEVVAAILHHQTERDEADVSDLLFDKFQKIATTRCLPEGASFEVIPTFGVEGGSTYTIWSVRIKMLQDEAGKEGWTYAFEIRDQFVSVKHGDAGEIHWGQPAESGLQAGVRLSPPLLSYELGQKIHVQIFYRNILSKPISAHVPNFCRYEAAVFDSNGAKMEVFDLQEPIVVGGAVSRLIGNEPISSHGQSLAFAPASLPKDEREDYRSETNASILILVKPSKAYRLQFTVSNLTDFPAEPLKTGEVEIAVDEVNADGTTNERLREGFKNLSQAAGTVPERTSTTPKENELSTTSKSSPEYPPVKIVVHDEEGKPREGVKVSLYQLAKAQGGQVLEINETSNASGLAVKRNLPYGHYTLSARTSDGWSLHHGSQLNVEFEKGLDVVLIAPTASKMAKLVIRSDLGPPSAAINELRFGELQEGNGPSYSAPYAPEPVAKPMDGEAAATKEVASPKKVALKAEGYESFPSIVNGIEYVGAEIDIELKRSIPQSSQSLEHIHTNWEWYPPENNKLRRRYLVANNEARGMTEPKDLRLLTREGSEFFRLPRSSFGVGASRLEFAEPTALPLDMDIPAGDLKVYIGRFYGKPNATVLAALNWRQQERTSELWLKAHIPRESAWIERLMSTTGWVYSAPGEGSYIASGHLLRREVSLTAGETLEVSLTSEHSAQKTPLAFEARTLDDITSIYNEKTRQLRIELFTPPIPDLTTAQMREAMLDAAEQYRKQGRVEVSSALKTSAETNRLANRLTFMGVTGAMSDGFRQITPQFHFEVTSNSLLMVVLGKAELRYSRNGWSSKAWGDIHPPITGKWELVSVEQRGETLTQTAYDEWRKTHENWTELTIDQTSLTIAGDNAAKLDFSVDYDAGPLPQYTIRQDGSTKYSGVLMGNGFIDDNELIVAIDLEGSSTPKTFHTKDGKSTKLTYRRMPAKPQS